MEKETAYFAVSVPGVGPRVLFDVSEDDKGNTYVTFNRGKRYRHAGSPGHSDIARREEVGYKNSKVSIHPPTERSREKLTTIHFTMKQNDGNWHEGHALTDAIETGTFTLLFYRSSAHVLAASYDFKGPPESHVSLGSYNPKAFTLLFIVLASGPDTPLSVPPVARHYCLMSHKLTRARITVLSTLLDLPSGPNGWTCWPSTISEKDRRARAITQTV